MVNADKKNPGEVLIDPKELTTNKLYDTVAKTYGSPTGVPFFSFPESSLLDKFTRSTDICLDIGIANGIFAIPLSRKVREILGIDVSPEMLMACRRSLEAERVTNVSIYERSATNLLFPDSFFDVVYSFATLVLVPDVERAYQEIVRVLKPGGYALVDITGKSNLSRIYWAGYYRKLGHWGINFYTLTRIKDIFRSLNMEVLEIYSKGFTDQWKYVPLLNKLSILDKIFHSSIREPDLDHKISQKLPALANRWVFVLKKIS